MTLKAVFHSTRVPRKAAHQFLPLGNLASNTTLCQSFLLARSLPGLD